MGPRTRRRVAWVAAAGAAVRRRKIVGGRLLHERGFEQFERVSNPVAGAVVHLTRTGGTLGHPDVALGVFHVFEHLFTDLHGLLVLLFLPAVGARDTGTGLADVLDADAVEVTEQLDGLPFQPLVA